MSDELKPCPFCGSEELKFVLLGDQRAYECSGCGARGPLWMEGGDIPYQGEFHLAWNRRPAPQPVGVKVKPLRWEGSFAHNGLGTTYSCEKEGTDFVLRRFEGSSDTGLGVFNYEEESRAYANADNAKRILSALDHQSALTANCCICGRIVDTREESEGGDKHGAQVTDGRWTCSSECWDAVAEETQEHEPTPDLIPRDEALAMERAMKAIQAVEESAPNAAAARERLMEIVVEAQYRADHVSANATAARQRQLDAARAEGRSFIRNLVSHATMGNVTNGDELSLNDASVAISKARNDLYEDAEAKGRRKALEELEALCTEGVTEAQSEMNRLWGEPIPSHQAQDIWLGRRVGVEKIRSAIRALIDKG